MDSGRCLLKEAKVNRQYQPEVIKAATYSTNRTLANTVELKTPFEIFFGEKPNVNYLRLYGSRVFVRTPEVFRQSKWDNKAQLGVLLGYTDVGYRVLINNRIIVARHVDIVENDIGCIGFDVESDGMSTSQTNENGNIIEQEENVNDNLNDERNESEYDAMKSDDEYLNQQIPQKKIKKSTRERKPNPKYTDENFVNYCIYVNYCDVNVPNTFEEAIECDDSVKWQEAMDKEIKSINENESQSLVRKPEDKKVIDVKWIYKKKSSHVYKARLVVRGLQQIDQVENTYSPVAKMETLKILRSYCCQNEFNIEQMDVETALLDGSIMSEAYVNQPLGYSDGTENVYKLKKSLYGLKESPRSWYECFHSFLEELNFNRSKYDYCLYVKHKKKSPVYIIIFVDDLLICSRDKNMIKDVQTKLSDRFKMKDRTC